MVLAFDPTVCPGDLSNTGPLRIGNHATPSVQDFYHGIIDEVSLYNRALSSNEVTAIYNAGSLGKCYTPTPPIILTQPTNQAVIVGDTTTVSVTAYGTAPLIYQWQSNGINLVDATNATLTLNNITLDQAGTFSVTVTNIVGSITSSNAVLSVYATAAATLNAFSFSGDNGFQFQVAGVPGFNYAVQESTNLMDWVPLITNTSPFGFTDTNTAGSQLQFYRTIYVP